MKRTRRGYVVCGGCLRHVQLHTFDGTEACPFCATRIEANAAGSAVSAAQAGGARSGLLFAALLGTASLGMGCGTADESDPTPAEDAQTPDGDGETGVDAPEPDAPEPDAPEPDAPEPDAPEPDAPGPDAPEPDLIDDTIPAPEYGVPADVVEDILDEEVIAEPLYGMPAEDVIEQDTPVEPPYGIPPMPDAEDDTDIDIEEPLPQPEYGLPPDFDDE